MMYWKMLELFGLVVVVSFGLGLAITAFSDKSGWDTHCLCGKILVTLFVIGIIGAIISFALSIIFWK